MGLVDEQERKHRLEILRATPARLKALLKGVPKAVLLWTPAPGKWSILEIVCHLRDMEGDAYLTRYRRILAEDTPRLPDIDGDTYSLERDYRAQKLSEVLRDWTRLRRESLKLLAGAKRGDWERAGVHETAGRLTLVEGIAWSRVQTEGTTMSRTVSSTMSWRRSMEGFRRCTASSG